MSGWNPNQYLKFAAERTQPCRDLAARIAVSSPRRVIDLGCGPGNSSAVLIDHWPDAEFTGLDSSAEMIDRARREYPRQHWIAGDIAEWAAASDGQFDVVFSNAAMQWVEDHAAVYPRLLSRVAPGGALAIQIPGWHHHEMEFYYDTLAPVAARLDLWATEYLHVLADVEAIVEWYRGTGLRPFLEVLETDAERQRFAADYLASLRPHFPPRAAGGVLFPFRRIFLIAYKGSNL
jgi:trans-aconitate 2-methyltransferase